MCEADDRLIFLRIFQKLIECTTESIYGKRQTTRLAGSAHL